MAYSIGEAAKAVGISKSTLSRAIKNGRISAAKSEDGSYSIDPAELHRVYPPISDATDAATVAGGQNDAIRNRGATGGVETQLRDQLRDRDDTIADLRRRLDQSEAERREAQARMVGLLTDQRPQPGFWARLFGHQSS